MRRFGLSLLGGYLRAPSSPPSRDNGLALHPEVQQWGSFIQNLIRIEGKRVESCPESGNLGVVIALRAPSSKK